ICEANTPSDHQPRLVRSSSPRKPYLRSSDTLSAPARVSHSWRESPSATLAATPSRAGTALTGRASTTVGVGVGGGSGGGGGSGVAINGDGASAAGAAITGAGSAGASLAIQLTISAPML